LTLALPLEAISHILPTIPKLESLEELSVTLRLADHLSAYDDILPQIGSFINRHSSTLTSIAIDTPFPKVDPASLFHALGSFPGLQAVSIGHPLERMKVESPTGIEDFLSNHASSIKKVKLQFYGPFIEPHPPSPSTFFFHPVFKVLFPRLTHLDLGLCVWDQSFRPLVKQHLAQYLGRSRSSLTSLVIRDYVLSFPEVQELVSVYGGGF